jgi:hypothetical protein
MSETKKEPLKPSGAAVQTPPSDVCSVPPEQSVFEAKEMVPASARAGRRAQERRE